ANASCVFQRALRVVASIGPQCTRWGAPDPVHFEKGLLPRAERPAQKRNLTASWTTRGSPAVVIVPKFAAPSTAAGAPNGGVLRRLNASARSSTAVRPAGIRRTTARSTSRYEGPRRGLRDAVPRAKAGAASKAAVLNQ